MSVARLGGGGRLLFVTTILTGSFLLFLVQPMIARIVLPRLGGTPAVWNSAMLVYQALLLGGYGYAHAIGALAPRRQAAVHLVVLGVAALWLPIGVLSWQLPAGAIPELWVPWLLAASIGPLFLAVAAQAPLVQRWFAAASGGEDPYRLYAASNLGSFAGLIAYPLLVEPGLTVVRQRWLWSGGYVVLVALVAACAFRLPRRAGTAPETRAGDPASPRRIAYWIALSMVPSGLMLATSTYLTTDIVAMPLLWVLPLGLYLLSFTVAFAGQRDPADVMTRVAPITVLLFGGVMIGGFQQNPAIGAAVALTLLFMASVALHTALYRARPSPERLTGFYLATSVGGALGGAFAGLLAPVLFDWTWEYPLLILAAGALIPQAYLTRFIANLWHRGRGVPALLGVVTVLATLLLLRAHGPADLFGDGQVGAPFVAIAILGLIAIGARRAYVAVLGVALLLFGGYDALRISMAGDMRTRSYFGVYTISETPDRRMLAHGTTMHGLQLLGDAARERTPTSYYSLTSGAGQALTLAPAIYGAAARVAVVGLGTGTLACYARPGEQWRFYEIDPAVVQFARNRFTYLSGCAPDAEIVLGDARVSLERAAPASLDMIALDAFSSDAVPMHLLTREAFAAYGRALERRGLLLVHVSNRFLNLSPVVAAAAAEGGWGALSLVDRPASVIDGASISHWIALSRDPAVLRRIAAGDRAWRPLRRRAGFTAWTDDYGSILPLLKF